VYREHGGLQNRNARFDSSVPRLKLARFALPLVLVLAAALLPTSATGAAAPCVATVRASGHHPKAGRPWPITVTCRTPGGAPVRATATYQFVFQGQVVATRYPSPKADPRSACSRAGTCRNAPWPFRGRMYDPTFEWPRRAVGIPLTLRVVVRVPGRGSVNLDYAVRARR
jgi:hypothetical protein